MLLYWCTLSKQLQDPVGPNGTNGLTFYFMMSTILYGDVPIYAKGSNFIPMDAFVDRATPSFGRSILQSAVDGNQNMIRVWSVEEVLAVHVFVVIHSHTSLHCVYFVSVK